LLLREHFLGQDTNIRIAFSERRQFLLRLDDPCGVLEMTNETGGLAAIQVFRKALDKAEPLRKRGAALEPDVESLQVKPPQRMCDPVVLLYESC
jgi:hypothetical protein